ncbi:TPA: hypothetical protein DCW61_01095 [Candidatus Uhrbacteria bacterium]|nr:hypothetical protein [Candidatus Uhrbacteria bacterium]
MKTNYFVFYKSNNRNILDILTSISVFFLILGFVVFLHERIFIIAVQAFFLIVMTIRLFFVKFKVNSFQTWSFLFFVFSISSSIWANTSSVAVTTSISFLQVAAVGNFLVLFADNETKLNYIKKIFIFSTLILIVRLLATSPIDTFLSMRFGAISGTEDLFNPNEVGRILVFSSLLTISLINKRSHLSLVICLLSVFAFFLIFTGSRSSILIYLLMILWLISKVLVKKKLILISLPIIVLLIFSFYFFFTKIPIVYSVIGNRIESFMGLLSGDTVDSSTISRLNLLKNGILFFAEKPLLGYGIGNYIELVSIGLYSHNNYLELLVGGGGVGLIIYYSLYLSLFSHMKKQRKMTDYSIVLFLIFSLLYFDLISVSYYSEISSLILTIVYAYAIMPRDFVYIRYTNSGLIRSNVMYVNNNQINGGSI